MTSFCKCRDIEINKFIIGCDGRHQQEVTMEHPSIMDVFTSTIDSQLQELNNRISGKAIEVFNLSSYPLDPSNVYKSFETDNICL